MNPISNIKNSKVILSALDWGFGHTTRCIPIIRTLAENKNEIHIAGNQNQIDFYQKEFPELFFHYLEGYNITLDDSKNTYWQLLLQKNKLSKTISRENKFLNELNTTHSFDFIISDNRYGFHLKDVTSYIICHQLNLQVPIGGKISNKFHHGLLSKFDACLVPDFEDRRLTKELSHASLKIPIIYIHPLCRFLKDENLEIKYDFCVIISGPEPARSNFFRKIESWSNQQIGKRVIIIGALASGTEVLEYMPKPTSLELNTIINQSNHIISRAGYTTIMELFSLNKKATLIPTKGQYEQEYLASNLKLPGIQFRSESSFFS